MAEEHFAALRPWRSNIITPENSPSSVNTTSVACTITIRERERWSSLSSFLETSRRILRYGNSFLPTFPEVLLAHASQMTGQLSRSMHIACKYWQAERQYKMRCTRQLHQNLLLHFAEQPRFIAYKLLQLTVEVRSSEGGLCMAAPLQRSGEYDVFLKMSPSALDQRWTWTLVMSSCRLNVCIPLTHRTCRTGHQPGFSRPPSMAERRAECRYRS